MVKIVIENLAKKEVLTNDLTHPVLYHLQSDLIDWMQACGGKGRCTTCAMIVLEGKENLSPLTTNEIKYRAQGALGKMERLACQSMALGDIRIAVPDEYKLPHVDYSDE